MKKLKVLLCCLFLTSPLVAEELKLEYANLDFKSEHFDSLSKAIIEQKKWSLPTNIKAQTDRINRLVGGLNGEVKDLSIDFSGYDLKFVDPTGKAEFQDFTFTKELLRPVSFKDALKVAVKGLSAKQLKGQIVFKHSRPGATMPAGGYLLDAGRKGETNARTLLPSDGDSQLAIFLPAQSDPNIYGLMVCPRKITKTGNNVTGRLLQPTPYVLSEISAAFKAQILAKVVDGFGPGKISADVVIEKRPDRSSSLAFSDHNEGNFPEAVSVLPSQYEQQSVKFQSASVNELAARANTTIEDSSGSKWIISFKRGVAVKEYSLTKSEVLMFSGAAFRVEPGLCYLAISHLEVAIERTIPDQDNLLNIK